MARKKLTKKAKSTSTKAKLQTKSVMSAKAATLEKNFLTLSSKLPQELRKDIAIAKKRSAKLLAALKKAKAQKKSANIAKVTAQLENTNTQIQLLTQKQTEYTALNKTIAALVKQQSVKKSNKIKSAMQGTKKSITKVKNKSKTTAIQPPKPVVEEPSIPDYTSELETELTS